MMARFVIAAAVLALAVHGLARSADDEKPIPVRTRTVTLDQLKDWILPETQVMKFEGTLPITDASGKEIKAEAEKDRIKQLSMYTGLRVYKAGDLWGVDTTYSDKARGRYTYKVEQMDGAIGIRSYTAQQGDFKGKSFAILDINSNGRFDDAGTDVFVWDKKTALKVGDSLELGEKEVYAVKIPPSGNGATFGKFGVGFGAAFKLPGETIDDGLAVWNAIRGSLGVPPVKRDPKIEEWGYKHIEYMKAVGNLQHEEDKNHPKYSPEGAKAGMGSCLGRGSPNPKSAILGQLTCFLHRIPLIKPEIETVAFCFDAESRFSGFDYSNGTKRSFTWKGPIAYPPDGATDFSPAWSGNEGPCPIPGGPPAGGVGQPITLTFGREKVTDAAIEVTGPGGTKLEGFISTPTSPAVSMFGNNMNTVCFIAKAPLQPNTRYQVKVTATVSGKPFELTWQFATGQQMNLYGGGGGRGRR